MKKQLSIYCGLRAIAWIVHTESETVQYGIKRLSMPFDHYYEFIAGLPISAMVNRRMKRQARRNLWRRKGRKQNLIDFLKTNGYINSLVLTREQILKLRVKALTHKLSKPELTAVFINLQHKRGYKSLRGVSDNENSDYLKEIEKHEQNRLQYKSIADYLLSLPSSKNIIFNRQSYEQEFNQIATAQQLPNDFRKKVFGLIYFQNPLKKGNIAFCNYEPTRKVIHASSPIYQEFRLWRDVNNIIIWDNNDNKLPISFETKQKWFDKLNNGTKITKASCCKDLGIKRSTSYQWLSGKAIAENPHAIFKKLNIKTNNKELWQDIYSATDDIKLLKLLKNKYKFDDFTCNELLDIDFSTLGYGDFSAKAIKKLLPLLKQGIKLKQAILQVYGKVDFKNAELRNWVVEKHFKAYQSLVKTIKSKYDIGEVKFEIDYTLKSGNKTRKAQAKNKRAKLKQQSQCPELNSYQLLKLQLWEESKGLSPYQVEPIDKDELFTDKWSIDHVVPKSKIFESGYSNMVLCPTKLNQQKGNKYTGLEFADNIGLKEHYLAVVENMPRNKQTNLKMLTADIPRDEISKRQNNDYNTKCFSTIGNATNIPNKLITRYIKQWGFTKYDEQDSRYYLVKAFIVANFSQETVNYFDNIQDIKNNPYGLVADLKPIDFENAPVFLQRPKFVRKTKYGYTPRFSLHKESVYGQRKTVTRNAKGEERSTYFYKIRQPLSSITKPMVNKIMDNAIKQKIEQRINSTGSFENMINSLADSPILHNDKPIKAVSVTTKISKPIALHSTYNGCTYKKNKHDKKIDFVFSAKNYSISLKLENEKLKKEVLSLYDFVNKINTKQPNTTSAIKLQENDIIELNSQLYHLIGASTSPALRSIYTLSATDTYKVKADDFKKMKKVLVNEMGETKKTIDIWQSLK